MSDRVQVHVFMMDDDTKIQCLLFKANEGCSSILIGCLSWAGLTYVIKATKEYVILNWVKCFQLGNDVFAIGSGKFEIKFKILC